MSLSDNNYSSHRDVRYQCSDHRPVSSNIIVDVIGKELADTKGIEGWSPTIMFFPTKEDADKALAEIVYKRFEEVSQ